MKNTLRVLFISIFGVFNFFQANALVRDINNVPTGTISVLGEVAYVDNLSEEWNINVGTNSYITFNIDAKLNGDYLKIYSLDASGNVVGQILSTCLPNWTGTVTTTVPTGRARITFVTDSYYCYSTYYPGFTLNYSLNDTYSVNQNLWVPGQSTVGGNSIVNGNMGIGASSLTQKLNVKGNLAISPNGTTSTETYNGSLMITKPAASGQYINLSRSGNAFWSIGTVYNSNTFAIGASTTSDASFTAPFFKIANTGSVSVSKGLSVGESMNAKSLTLYTYPANVAALRLANSDSNSASDSPFLLFTSGSSSYNIGTALRGLNESTSSSKKAMAFYAGWTGDNNMPIDSLKERMRISSNGYVGIGTKTPRMKLHVNNGDNTDASILASASAGNNLVVSSLNPNTQFGTVFKITHEFFDSERRNGYIAFHRGGNSLGGFLDFGTNGLSRMTINTDGFVGIGTANPQYMLDVKGTIRATEIKVVSVDSIPDYVFEPEYQLQSLSDVNAYIQSNKHLPNIPSAAEIKENGLSLVDMQVKLLKKVEELTLYAIDQQKRIEQLEKLLQKSNK